MEGGVAARRRFFFFSPAAARRACMCACRLDSSLGDFDDGTGELAMGAETDEVAREGGKEAMAEVEEVEEEALGGGWRKMMLEDGWAMDAEGELTGEITDATDGEDDD